MRLIDADMLLNSFKGAKKLGVDAIKYYVDNTPTIDLVRCGECIHHDDGLCHRPKWSFAVEPTDFCSYGERRTDPNNCKGCKLTNECDRHICIKAIRERRADE